MVWPFPDSRERLRREAAAWLAKLQGPDADATRQAFDDWYASSPERAAAFDRIKGHYEAAGLLRHSDAARERGLASRRPGSRRLTYAVAAAVAGVAVLAFFLLGAGMLPSEPGMKLQSGRYAAAAQGRRMVLADGSVINLSPASVVSVDLGRTDRRLHLLRGEGRFSVAHEVRPFIVVAGRAEVVAHGTEFVVRLGNGRTTVALIAGAVDVSYASVRGGPAQRATRLSPGDTLVMADPPVRVPPSGAMDEKPRPAPAMLEFDGTPLAAAIAAANRTGGPQIRIEPGIASLRVTGGFRAGDTAGLAASLAAAFNLEVVHAPDGTLLLRTNAANPARP